MLTNADGQPGTVGQQANPGGRSQGDPTPVGDGGMGPTALGQNTRYVWVDDRYVVDLQAFVAAYEVACRRA